MQSCGWWQEALPRANEESCVSVIVVRAFSQNGPSCGQQVTDVGQLSRLFSSEADAGGSSRLRACFAVPEFVWLTRSRGNPRQNYGFHALSPTSSSGRNLMGCTHILRSKGPYFRQIEAAERETLKSAMPSLGRKTTTTATGLCYLGQVFNYSCPDFRSRVEFRGWDEPLESQNGSEFRFHQLESHVHVLTKVSSKSSSRVLSVGALGDGLQALSERACLSHNGLCRTSVCPSGWCNTDWTCDGKMTSLSQEGRTQTLLRQAIAQRCSTAAVADKPC